MWYLLLLAATVWSFAYLPLGLSDRNNIRNTTGDAGISAIRIVQIAFGAIQGCFWKSLPLFRCGHMSTHVEDEISGVCLFLVKRESFYVYYIEC